MFQEVIKLTQGKYHPESFSIEQAIWKAKHEASNMHKAIIDAECDLPHVHGFTWDAFSRENLRDVWSCSECSFPTKYITTLWWGGVFPLIFNKVFSDKNLTRLLRISPSLEQALVDASLETDFGQFNTQLADIVTKMQDGAFRVPYVGPAFFTKVIQFFFASHGLAARQNFLPIIADTWLMRAVFSELTDRKEIAKRDSILIIDNKNVFLRKDGHGHMTESYLAYIEYFNLRCAELGVSPWFMEASLFKNELVRNHYKSIIDVTTPISVPEQPGELALQVYNKEGHQNHGKTFRILNNKAAPDHHSCDQVFVVFQDEPYEATIGTYNRGNTLRGSDTIEQLIKTNNWSPGQVLPCEFELTPEGNHIYRVVVV